MGKYSVDPTAVPAPISWTKATPNCDFISTKVLDYLCFDARENERRLDGGAYNMGNPSYLLSNINLFMNSADSEWYFHQHPTDNAPLSAYRDVIGSVGMYKTHFGFLHYFEDYELSNILTQVFDVDGEEVVSKIRLPKRDDIFGTTKFNLFKKRGVRGHPTEDFIMNLGLRTGYDDENKYVPYFLADKYVGREAVTTIDRTGYCGYAYPAEAHGFRPVCRINPDAKVEEIAPNVYSLIPFDASSMEIGTTEEILELLGLV